MTSPHIVLTIHGFPCTSPIIAFLKPYLSKTYSTALFPIGATTLGFIIPRSLSKCFEHASIPLAFGLLFLGGLHCTTFEMRYDPGLTR